jgi:hypothetical protein
VLVLVQSSDAISADAGYRSPSEAGVAALLLATSRALVFP